MSFDPHFPAFTPPCTGIRLAVAGLIGAGKTTLCANLQMKLDATVVTEPASENPHLAPSYADPKTHAFDAQICMLALRTRTASLKEQNEAENVIFDRHLREDPVFARLHHVLGNLTDDQMGTYTMLCNTLFDATNAEIPRMYIFLDITPAQALERIRARGRPMEKDIAVEYLEMLNVQYQKWLDEIARVTCVVRVNWEEFLDVDELWERLDYDQHAGVPGLRVL
jgi:deoxyadenosine/deoxycytidine kinase